MAPRSTLRFSPPESSMPESTPCATVLRIAVNVYRICSFSSWRLCSSSGDFMLLRRSLLRVVVSFTLGFLGVPATLLAQTPSWSTDKAKAWYDQQPWLVGSNYIPSDAINELEMWQAESFNPAEIDKELGWAEDMGMSTMRVFLHDLVWKENPQGFKQRIAQF